MATPTRLTKAGAILLAKAIAGNTLTFTRGAFGDAAGHSAPTEREIDNLTGLLNEKQTLRITDYQIKDEQIIITLMVTNEGVATSFRIAEGGLFARDPVTEAEVLYAYFYDGEEGDQMPAGGTEMQIEYSYEITTIISNAANVVCMIDKTTIGIMRDEFEAHINSAEPHPNWDVIKTNGAGLWKQGATLGLEWASANQLGGIKVGTGLYMQGATLNTSIAAIGAGLWSENDTIGLNVAAADQLGGFKVGKNLYMEGESLNASAEETDVESRLKQLEINQANLYILLDATYGLGTQSNLQRVENYAPVSSSDNYSARAYSTQSKNYLRVFSPGSLRVGGYFTVTDGLSFAKRGDYDTPYIAHLAQTLSRDYKGTNYIYRSTVTVKDNKAYGAGEKKTRVRGGTTESWKGEGTSDSQTLTFNAYESLAGSFDLDGDWAFTSDGYFTVE